MRPARTAVVHGNTLTAATVAHNVRALLAALAADPAAQRGRPPRPPPEGAAAAAAAAAPPGVFLTGPTSKVGKRPPHPPPVPY